MIEREFLSGIARVYQSARDSDDGERCMVAPSPQLRERIKAAIASLAASGGLPQALSLHAAEPRVLGLNDGVIIPPEEFAAGTAPSIIRSAAARAKARRRRRSAGAAGVEGVRGRCPPLGFMNQSGRSAGNL